MNQGIINKNDYYSNDSFNQGANAFNLDKYKNDPRIRSLSEQAKTQQKNLVSKLLTQEFKQQIETQLI